MKSIRIKKDNQKIHFYDSFGRFQYLKVIYNMFMLTIFTTIYQFAYLVVNKVILIKFSKDMLQNILYNYINFQYSFYSNFFNYPFLTQKIQLYILPFYIIVAYITLSIYMYLKSLKVQKLNKLGLEDYKITKYKKVELVELKSKKYEEFDFDYVSKLKNDIIQIFQFPQDINVLVLRHKKDKIRIEIEKQFAPVLNLDITKLQKNKFYLGQKIVNNRVFTDDYLDFSQLLHTAILGTSGGGKSVFLNHLIINIFFNFELLKEFIFIDFKGGIEAQTYLNVAQKLGLDNIKTCDNNIQKLHQILTDIYNINQKRMDILKQNNQKKWKDEFIYLIFDEFAQIFQYAPKNKDEKKLLDESISIIENLFATARSQNIRIIYSTQSYVKEASGITNAIKVNTGAKFMFNTKAVTSISSVVNSDVLDEYQLNPKLLKKGECLALDIEDVAPHRFKSPYSDNLQSILVDILQHK